MDSQAVLHQILNRIGTFTSSDCSIFESHVSIKNIEKGNQVLRANDICKSLFYIIDGSFFQFKLSEELDQNILDLHSAGEWVFNSKSFIKQTPSESIIEAYAPSKVLEIDVYNIHALIARSPSFLQIGKVLEPKHSRLEFLITHYRLLKNMSIS